MLVLLIAQLCPPAPCPSQWRPLVRSARPWRLEPWPTSSWRPCAGPMQRPAASVADAMRSTPLRTCGSWWRRGSPPLGDCCPSPTFGVTSEKPCFFFLCVFMLCFCVFLWLCFCAFLCVLWVFVFFGVYFFCIFGCASGVVGVLVLVCFVFPNISMIFFSLSSS